MRTLVTLMLALLCFAAEAQKPKKPKINKVQPALDAGNYTEAKVIVDDAIEYEKTKIDPQTWFLRGQVYAALDTALNEEGALEEAMKSFDKAVELDPEQKKIRSVDFATGQVVDVDSKKQGIYAHYYNLAIEDYNESDFEGATDNFETAFYIVPSDTNAILNAAYAASAASMKDRAKTNFEKAYEAGSTDKTIFLQLYNYAVQDEDYDAALVAIQKGRKVLPDDVDLMKYEVNMFIQMKKTDEAFAGLNKAIAAEPSNPDLYFSMGVLKEETGDVEGALAEYRKAIEADPDHYNSNFNLAVSVFNAANEMMKERNNLGYKETKKFDELTVSINDQLNTALPLWEKLYSLDSKDETVLETLGYIYTNLKMNDKAEKIMDELDAVKG